MPVPNNQIEVTVAFTAREDNKKLKGELEVKYSGPIVVLLDTNMANPLNQAYKAFLQIVIEELAP